MPRPRLALLVLAALGAMVLFFFFLRLRSVLPKTDDRDATVGEETLTRPSVTYVNPSKGPATAPVTLAVFGDFQCAACKELAATLDALMRSFPDDVRVVWKDMPNEEAHPVATKAAVAAHCADRQGKFWEFHDALFERQAYLSEAEIDAAALATGLDLDAFSRCAKTNDTLSIVRRDFEEGRALRVLGTPTTFVGDESFAGALSLETLTSIVRQRLVK